MSKVDLRIAVKPEDVLKVMVIRGIVFLEEQAVDWKGEFDEFEDEAIHVLGEIEGQPVVSGRLRMLSGDVGKLERIAVRPRWRGRGLARDMTRFLMDLAAERGARRLKLHAQSYLQDFYSGYGFEREGPVFDECGIDHVLMVQDIQGKGE